ARAPPSRASSTTCAPAAAQRAATARPTPRDAPVTTTVRPPTRRRSAAPSTRCGRTPTKVASGGFMRPPWRIPGVAVGGRRAAAQRAATARPTPRDAPVTTTVRPPTRRRSAAPSTRCGRTPTKVASGGFMRPSWRIQGVAVDGRRAAAPDVTSMGGWREGDAMKVLITGGAGYIGSTVGLACRDKGWDVVVLDDLSTGRAEFTDGTAFYQGDIADHALVARIFEEHPDIAATVHCAAKIVVPESVADPIGY